MNLPEPIRSSAGRNPSIDRDSIAAAVRKVGLREPVSVNKVAAELGVNVTTVYRHTGGLEGLKRIHALQLFENLGQAPSHEGKAWQEWLLNLGNFYRDAFLNNPDLLKYAQAGLDPRFRRLEQATRILIDYGFQGRHAISAHAFLINNVVGYVHQELQTRKQKSLGSTPVYQQLKDALQQGDESLPTLTTLQLDEDRLDEDNNFNFFLRYAIKGIAVNSEIAK